MFDALIDESPVLGAVALTRVWDPRQIGPAPQEKGIVGGMLDGLGEEGAITVVDVGVHRRHHGRRIADDGSGTGGESERVFAGNLIEHHSPLLAGGGDSSVLGDELAQDFAGDEAGELRCEGGGHRGLSGALPADEADAHGILRSDDGHTTG